MHVALDQPVAGDRLALGIGFLLVNGIADAWVLLVEILR